MSADKKDFLITPLLKRGKENAVSTDDLKKLTGIKNDREIRHAVKKERLLGSLILSNSGRYHGYYMPQNRREAEEFVRSMRSRAISEFSSIKSIRSALKRSKYGADLYHQLDITEMLREADGT